MAPIRERIRQAREASGLCCAELARRVGVGRTAAVLWEKEDGTTPSVDHLSVIAIVLGVNFEWLATGRGPMREGEGAELPALMFSDFAHNQAEDRLLKLSRRLNPRNRDLLVRLLEALVGITVPATEKFLIPQVRQMAPERQ